MADFTPINSQEELDRILAPRLQRERENAVKPFKDYDQIKADLEKANKTLGERDATITELTGQLKSTRTDLAKTRIAFAKGLPPEFAERLRGETDEEIGKDADGLLTLISAQHHGAEPARRTDPVDSGRKLGGLSVAGMQELINNLNLGGN